ncbi:MAG: Ig-like domain-containing protein [Candidatus Parcubacteria bacterium]|nr:Ig-like domain-containing protein [Candidatus Parcubacteria bacterium]
MKKNYFGNCVVLIAITVMAIFITGCQVSTGNGGRGGDTTVIDKDHDGYPFPTDCDDGDSTLHTWYTYHLDTDGDGRPEPGGDFTICGGDTAEFNPGYTTNPPPWDECPNNPAPTCGNDQLPTGTLTCTVAGATVTMTVSNVQDDETVTRTDFWEGASIVGTDNTAPFGLVLTHVATGSHTYVGNLVDARADNDTNTCSVTVGTTVGNPSVTIINPANNATETQNVAFNVDATVVYATTNINMVAFYLDNSTTATCTDSAAPYSCSVTIGTIGNHTITATAYASNGRTGSATINVNVSATVNDPVVTITNPANNATETQNVAFNVDATVVYTAASINMVSFYVDNSTTATCTDSAAPYSCSVTIATIGNHTITATAYASNGRTGSATINVNVSATVNDPVVTITNPANNATETQNVAFNVDATVVYTAASINMVSFYVDNSTTATCTDSAAPYSCSVTLATTGNHTITATAYAANGHTGSASITVGVVTGTVQGPCTEIYFAFATGNYDGSIYGNGFFNNPPLPDSFPQMWVYHNAHEVTAKGILSPLALQRTWFDFAINFLPEICNQDGCLNWFPYQDNTGTVQSGIGRGIGTLEVYYLPQCNTNDGALLLDCNTVDNGQRGGNFRCDLTQGVNPVTGNSVDIDAGIVADTDGDHIPNSQDNCIWVYNPDQAFNASNPIYNAAGARTGTLCQGTDSDNDGWLDANNQDQFPLDYTKH